MAEHGTGYGEGDEVYARAEEVISYAIACGGDITGLGPEVSRLNAAVGPDAISAAYVASVDQGRTAAVEEVAKSLPSLEWIE